MKLHQSIDSKIKHNQALSRTYSNSQFGPNFASFMEALSIDQLISSDITRIKTNEGHVWYDGIGKGGIAIITTKHPLLEGGNAGDVVVKGTKHGIELFENVLKKYATFEGIDTKDVKVKIEYHDELNPALWDSEDQLNSDVYASLLKAGTTFFEFMKVPKVKIHDIILTGSCANYNWTESSDIDLHVVIDMDDAKDKYGSIVKEYFDAKKSVWNELHDILIKGIPVEFYVQDETEKHYSTGVYSILNDEWNTKPEHKKPTIDDLAVKEKTASFMQQIDSVMDSNKASAVEMVMDKIKSLRKAGLEEAGEFSTGNLVFKALRNNGYLEKLSDLKTKTFDRELSVEEEEWSYLMDEMRKLPIRQPYIHY